MKRKSKKRFHHSLKINITREMRKRLFDIKQLTGLPYSEMGRIGLQYIIDEFEKGNMEENR